MSLCRFGIAWTLLLSSWKFDILPEQKAQRPTKVLPDVAKKLRDEIESTLNPPA